MIEWRPLSVRNDVPLIIAGPIVRRVEPAGVTVFVALSDRDTVTLTVTDAAGAVVATNGGEATVALGDSLHVLATTATPSTGASLKPGVVYTYLLEFASLTVTGTDNFDTAMGDAGLRSICYPRQTRPSFCLPPTDLGAVKIVHTSCRKAHGETTDALPIVDQLLADAIAAPAADPTANRPQQLYLTGDQTYSDDVCDALLAMCVDAAGWLLGARRERVPRRVGLFAAGDWNYANLISVHDFDLPDGASFPWPDGPTNRWPGVGLRGPHVYATGYTAVPPDKTADRELADIAASGKPFVLDPFTTLPTKAAWEALAHYQLTANHIMLLGEFYAMLLMSWSPVLWDVPDGAARIPLPFYGDLDGASWRAKQDPALGQRPDVLNRRAAAADRLRDFQQGLTATRRALANIATYMIFDDHDVTDDWFMNREWCDRVVHVDGDTLGRRMIRNALICYAVFQAWGNTPDRFARLSAATAGGALLAALDSGAEMASDLDALEHLTADQPCVSNYVGVPWSLPAAFDGGTTALERSSRTLTWNYRWGPAGWPFEVLVTDCRTVRGYESGGLAPPILLDDAPDGSGRPNQIRAQIPTPDHAAGENFVTLVVVQTPLLGVTFIEDLQKLTAIFGVQKVFDKDDEAWGLNNRAQQGLIARLVEHNPNTVVLSGDVHYAFAQYVDYRATRPYGSPQVLTTARTGRLVQLCSSSARNETGDTRTWPDRLARLPEAENYVGSAVPPAFSAGYPPPSAAAIRTPYVTPAVAWDPQLGPGDWTLRFHRVHGAGSFGPPPPPPSAIPMVNDANLMFWAYQALTKPLIVGVNNVALVDFTGNTAATRAVRQTVYTRTASAAAPTTASNTCLFVVPLQYTGA